jgi:uncharacterized protein YchJ
MNHNSSDEKLIKAWKTAAEELGLDIISHLQMNTENGKVSYPVFVKHFGRKKGTIIARHALFMDYPMPKDKDYYFSAVNRDSYSKYNRESFIETLEDWGYYGDKASKPEWYNGHVYE